MSKFVNLHETRHSASRIIILSLNINIQFRYAPNKLTASQFSALSIRSLINSAIKKHLKVLWWSCAILFIHSSMTQLFVGPWPLPQFRKYFYTDNRAPRTGGQPVAGQNKQNESRQTTMPCVGFEPKIPVFEQAKKVLALDRANTVIQYVQCPI
jgi:hypothetical protein